MPDVLEGAEAHLRYTNDDFVSYGGIMWYSHIPLGMLFQVRHSDGSFGMAHCPQETLGEKISTDGVPNTLQFQAKLGSAKEPVSEDEWYRLQLRDQEG